MKLNKHIAESDLRQVVLERQTELSQDQIETHVSECEFCQTRLLEIAADTQWREDFSNSLKELSGTEQSGIDTGEFSVKQQAPVGDEFDLVTVDQMLKDVLEPPTHPEMLGRLNRYDIEGIIGCGGMGVVLRGFDRDLHRPVAIKMILPRLSRNGTAKQRFEREACAAAAVLHPNVIAIHGISQSSGVPWFAMPLIAGPSLGKIVRSNGPLPEREIVRIGMQIASGLSAAHSQGLVHRDIKPENILVDNQVNRVVITDFGLARRDSEESMTQTGMLAGTLNYMSPEQSRGEDIDSRSDLFSLGSLLFYLAAGVVPFKSEAPMKILHKIGNEDHPDVRSLNPEISKTLAHVIERLLQKSPDHRFQSAAEVEQFLESYLAHLNHPTKFDPPAIRSTESNQNKRRWFFGVAASLALLATVLGIQNLSGPDSATELETSDTRTANPSKSGKTIAPTETAETSRSITELSEHIRNTYQITDSQTFESDLRLLEQSIQNLDESINLETNESFSSFDDELSKLSREIEQLNQLNWPGADRQVKER